MVRKGKSRRSLEEQLDILQFGIRTPSAGRSRTRSSPKAKRKLSPRKKLVQQKEAKRRKSKSKSKSRKYKPLYCGAKRSFNKNKYKGFGTPYYCFERGIGVGAAIAANKKNKSK